MVADGRPGNEGEVFSGSSPEFFWKNIFVGTGTIMEDFFRGNSRIPADFPEVKKVRD